MWTYRQYLSESYGIKEQDAYASALLGEHRVPEIEPFILNEMHAYCILEYAIKCIHGLWPEGEKIYIKKDFGPNAEYDEDSGGMTLSLIQKYMKMSHKKRWPELERAIVKYTQFALSYAHNVFHAPWPEAEKHMISINYDPMDNYFGEECIEGYLNDYYGLSIDCFDDFKKYRFSTEKTKWNILKNSPTRELIETLSALGMTKDQQEYAIQHWPDLANRIKNLDPSLAEKYKAELELGTIDV